MILPEYWLPRPPMPLDERSKAACDALFRSAVAQGLATPMPYTLPIPKWQFLDYLAEQHQLVFHGSGNPDIACFEPRHAIDLAGDFGSQQAVYAAGDGIWPMYFAIVDRHKSPTISNGCISLELADGSLGDPHYFFSISHQAWAHHPYRTGVVYLLSRATFTRQPPLTVGAQRIHTTQWASLVAVPPLTKLEIHPEDFPFLAQMRTHVDERLAEYADAIRHGLPWPA
jgi:hypothetical protein